MALDASVLVAAFLPDAIAPTLLSYEVANSLVTAEQKMSRLPSHEVEAILADLDHLGIELVAVPAALVAGTARRYKCSAYDAAYVGLAEQHRVILVTADRCLWESVGPRCERLRWIERSDAKTQA